MEENTIVIKRNYFNNIEKAVTALNNFFSSNYQTKDFVNITDDTDLDEGVRHIIDVMDDADPRWMSDPTLVDEAIDKINSVKEDMTEYFASHNTDDFFAFCADTDNKELSDIGYDYLSFKAIQFIADNFEAFNKFMNGLYSFDLFINPSAYKNEIELFSNNVPTGECSDVFGNFEYPLFDVDKYVDSLFENDDIEFPEGMDAETEKTRMNDYGKLDQSISVKITDEPVQEAADVNYFTNTKPKHIKYSNGKWSVSDQFKKTTGEIIDGIRKCDTTDDLKSFFESNSKKYESVLNETVVPFILSQAMIKKGNASFNKYSDSYKSILKKNKGAKRFENYDIFTTFKADKNGTIKFLEDFFNLNLANNGKSSISNNTLLTLFNIFDSRIYFDILYNMIPEKEKRDKGMDEDSFVKQIRGRINTNSRSMNTYENDTDVDTTEQTSTEVKEYSYNLHRSLGDMSISDMVMCEAWTDMLYDEVNTLSDGLYHAGIPMSATAAYIEDFVDEIDSKRFDIFQEGVKEHGDLVGKTVLGALIGVLAPTIIAFSPLGMTAELYFALVGILPLSSSLVSHAMAKKTRGKNVKSEILRDINSVIRAFSKDADEIDAFLLKDLKKRCKVLTESLSFALTCKDMFSDTEKEFIIDLLHATKRMKELSVDNIDRNKMIVEKFFKASDPVIKLLAKIKDNEVSLNEITHQNEPEEDQHTETEGELEGEASTEIEEPDEDDDVENVQEADTGAIPAYMRTRVKVSDETGKKKTTVEDVDAPSDDGSVPSNPIDDLADSIDEKVNSGDDINDILGKDAKSGGNNIVYNVTNNYNYSNSFNKNDLSTGKQTTIDQSVHSTKSNDLSSGKQTTSDQSVRSNKSNDLSSGKQTSNDQSVRSNKSNDLSSGKDASMNTNADSKSNNKYNSAESSNTSGTKKVQEFSTGYSVEDVFALLESEGPVLEASSAKPPTGDSLTKAMDRDMQRLPKQQAAKKRVEKTVATTKALGKPINRTKHWLLGILDSLVRRREDKVKADIIQSPSYRTALFRATKIAIKAGLVGVAFTISGYLGAAYVVLLASNQYDKHRLRKEIQAEFETEIRILDDKIRLADQENTPESRRAKWQMMRLRSKMEHIVANEVTKTKVVHPMSTQ